MKDWSTIKPLKVVYIVSDIDKALAFEWIVERLSGSIHLAFILIGKKNTALEAFLKGRKMTYHIVADEDYPSFLTRTWKVIRHLRSMKPDVVHSHLWRATVSGISAAWLLSIKKRIFTRHHAMIHYREYPSGKKWDRLMNRLATHIIAISNNVRHILVTRDGASENKVEVIHHGFDLMYFENRDTQRVRGLREKHKLEKHNTPVIGVIARYVEWKGISYVIEAFRQLRQRRPSAHLVLANAAGNYSPQIKAMLGGLSAHSYTEIVFEENLAALYQLFDIYVHVPVDKDSEAFGQTYVEALAAGVPSVFTLSGVAPDFIRDGDNALVVPYRDASAIDAAIEKLLTNTSLRETLIKNGKASVSREFSLEVMLSKLENLYLKNRPT